MPEGLAGRQRARSVELEDALWRVAQDAQPRLPSITAAMLGRSIEQSRRQAPSHPLRPGSPPLLACGAPQ